MEDFLERSRNGAGVGVGGHDVRHVFPPSTADLGVGDGLPAGLVLDLRVGEELAGLGVQVDGVVVDAVGAEHVGEFLPDGLVAPGILGLLAGMHGHDEGFADHGVAS